MDVKDRYGLSRFEYGQMVHLLRLVYKHSLITNLALVGSMALRYWIKDARKEDVLTRRFRGVDYALVGAARIDSLSPSIVPSLLPYAVSEKEQYLALTGPLGYNVSVYSRPTLSLMDCQRATIGGVDCLVAKRHVVFCKTLADCLKPRVKVAVDPKQIADLDTISLLLKEEDGPLVDAFWEKHFGEQYNGEDWRNLRVEAINTPPEFVVSDPYRRVYGVRVGRLAPLIKAAKNAPYITRFLLSGRRVW